jgi:hypothetical protein
MVECRRALDQNPNSTGTICLGDAWIWRRDEKFTKNSKLQWSFCGQRDSEQCNCCVLFRNAGDKLAKQASPIEFSCRRVVLSP